MIERDCNTCAHHVQGRTLTETPQRCWTCVGEVRVRLPEWKPIEAPRVTVKDIREIRDSSPIYMVDPSGKHPPKVIGAPIDIEKNIERVRGYAFPYNLDPTKGGIKNDAGKVRVELLPFRAIEAIGEVMTWATTHKKGPDGKPYPDDNWRKGMSWRRVGGAALRHVFAFLRGEDRDEESGLLHIAHAGCCIVFLIQYAIESVRYASHDDRAKE